MKNTYKAKTQSGVYPRHNFLLFNNKKLSQRIKRHEGFSDKVYLDRLGNPTIGYGHLIKKNEDFKNNKKYNRKLLNYIFNKDLSKAIKDYNKIFKRHRIPKEIEEIIIEMIFQLGIKNFLKFKKMIKAIKKYNFLEAKEEMLNSRWNQQAPRRVRNLVAIIDKKYEKKQ